MPGLNIHIAVANEYLKKNNIKDRKKFLKGNIYPDLCLDKNKSHFSGYIYKNDLVKSLKNKVNIKKFIIENGINNDFDKGILLHLITDYYFYNEFFDKSYLSITSLDKFKNDLYFSLDSTDKYIKKKYNIKYEVYKLKILKEFYKIRKYKYYYNNTNIITINKLDEFINEMSLIDLDDLENKYKNI